jgi:glycosyl transferase family 25
MPAISAYMINLDRRQDRLERLGGQLDALGVKWTRVSAVDAEIVGDECLSLVISQTGPLGQMGRGDRACSCSHVKAWRAFLDDGSEYGLFLEDDVFLAQDTGTLLASDAWMPPDVDVVKLEKFKDGVSEVLMGPDVAKLPYERTLIPLLSRHVGGAAYILSRKAAQAGVAQAGHMRVPVDHLWFNGTVSHLARRFQPYIVHPAMATQRAFGYNSDIAKHGKAIKPKGWGLRWRKLKRGAYEVRLLPRQLLKLWFGGARIRPYYFEDRDV